MHHESISIVRIATALLASGVLACSLDDDDQPPAGDAGGTGPDKEVCLEQLEAAQAECLPGMSFHSSFQSGGGSIILIDDPGAAVGVGPDAWLVQVGAQADYVASYLAGDANCSAGCGWCQPGDSMCYQDLDENHIPVGCFMCLAYGTPDAGSQCAEFMAVCGALDETGEGGPDDDGADETGVASDSGAMALAEGFDCRDWNLEHAVVLDEGGDVIVDAAIIEMAASHFGEPLAKCDGTRFRQRSDGYFEVSALADDGLLARIGLAPRDVIFEVDGESMRDADRVVAKAMDLFMGARPTSEVMLVVLRGGKAINKVIHIR